MKDASKSAEDYMKAIGRRIVLEAIGVAVMVIFMTILFEMPYDSILANSVFVIGVNAWLWAFRTKRWGWFRNVSQNQIDEKTEANISALSTLAFIASIALIAFLKHSQKQKEAERVDAIPRIENRVKQSDSQNAQMDLNEVSENEISQIDLDEISQNEISQIDLDEISQIEVSQIDLDEVHLQTQFAIWDMYKTHANFESAKT